MEANEVKRNFKEIKNSLVNEIQTKFPIIIKDIRTPEEATRDFLIYEIAKLKYELQLLKERG